MNSAWNEKRNKRKTPRTLIFFFLQKIKVQNKIKILFSKRKKEERKAQNKLKNDKQ